MKSPHTLIKLHERAIWMQEMISRANKFCESNSKSAERYTLIDAITYGATISHHHFHADRYYRISNYLQKRYNSLITKLQ